MSRPRHLRVFGGLGMAATALACPCHVLSLAVVALLGIAGNGAQLPVSPAVQDAVHGVYVPLAAVAGAALLSPRRRRRIPRQPPGQ